MQKRYQNLYTLPLCLLILFSCQKPEVTYDGLKKDSHNTGIALARVNNVSIQNDQLVINGIDLNGVTNVRVTGPAGFDESFSIESKSSSTLVANGFKNISFAIGAIFSLIISDAHGAATFQVTFSLQDGAVTASKLDSMGAGVGQVLKYNGTTWVPSDLSGLTYAGNWNASTNTPDLLIGGNLGEYYIVTASGPTDLLGGPGTNAWNIGDWAVWNSVSNQWEKIDNATSMQSFNGRSGAVAPQSNDYTWAQIDKTTSSIGDLSNVDTAGAVNGKVLKFDGTNWVVGDDLSGGGAGSVTTTEIQNATIIDADISGSAAIAQSKVNNLVGDLTTINSNVSTNTTDIATNATAISGKEDAIAAGTTAQFFRGDKTWQALNKAVVGLSNVDDVQQMPLSYIDIDNTLTADSDSKVPSQKAIKAYVDTAISGVAGGDFMADGSVAMTAVLDASTFGVKLKDGDTNYVTLKSNAAMSADFDLVLPSSAGASGEVLTTDGSGNLSWSAQTTDNDTTYTAGTGLSLASTTFHVDVGTSANKIVQLDGTGKLPAIDGSQLANLPNPTSSTVLSGFVTGADSTVINNDTVEVAVEKLQGQVDGNNTDIATNTTAISGKEATITAGTTGQYYRGDKSWQTLDATAVGLASVTNDAQIPLANRDNGALSTSTTNVPTSGAVKTYVDAQVSGVNESQWTTNAGDISFVSGSVGVGTTSPGAKLHVENGGMLVSGTTFSGTQPVDSLLIDQSGSTSSFSAKGSGLGSGELSFYSISGLGTSKKILSMSNGRISTDNSPLYIYDDANGDPFRIHSGYNSNNSKVKSLFYFEDAGNSSRKAAGIVSTLIDNTSGSIDGGLSFETVNDGVAAEQLFIDNTGNIGIGTTSPTAKLEILDTGSTISWFKQISNGASVFSLASFKDTPLGSTIVLEKGRGGDYTTPTSLQAGDTIGKFQFKGHGSGISTAAASLSVTADGDWSDVNNAEGHFIFMTRNTGSLLERMRLSSNGNLGIGITAPDDALDVVGDIDATGCFQNNNAGTIGGTCVSDKRLKDDIRPLENSLKRILGLQPVQYIWRPDYAHIHHKEGQEIGLIAQEVETVFPEMVVEKEDGFKRVKYDISMRLHIINAIKEFFAMFMEDKSEQDRKIASLKTENKKIKEVLNKIEDENKAMKGVICDLRPEASICP